MTVRYKAGNVIASPESAGNARVGSGALSEAHAIPSAQCEPTRGRLSRRRFLAFGTLPLAGSSLGVPPAAGSAPPRELRIRDAYYLWYNAPNVAALRAGFCIGYLTSGGEVRVAAISEELDLLGVTTLHVFQDASDHGSPAILRVPAGRHQGHLLACFSNHATELLCRLSRYPGRADDWGSLQAIDAGRCTYPSLSALPNGDLMLLYTTQHTTPGEGDSGEWRRTVCVISRDGGASWGAPTVVADHGRGTFPYAAPLATSEAGTSAVVYSLYSSARKQHQGLRIVVSSDGFSTTLEHSIEQCWRDRHADVVPISARWISDHGLWILFSVRSPDAPLGEVMLGVVSLGRGGRLRSRVLPVAEPAVHGYLGSAAFHADRSRLVYAPVGGGLTSQCLFSGSRTVLRPEGEYASPLTFRHGQSEYLVVLENPDIRSTRRFRADLLVMRLE